MFVVFGLLHLSNVSLPELWAGEANSYVVVSLFILQIPSDFVPEKDS